MTAEEKINQLLKMQSEGKERSEIAEALGYSWKRPDKSLHKFITNNGYIRVHEVYIKEGKEQGEAQNLLNQTRRMLKS